MTKPCERTILTVGLPGAGKTWLLHAICRELARDFSSTTFFRRDGKWEPISTAVSVDQMSPDPDPDHPIEMFFEFLRGDTLIVRWHELNMDRFIGDRIHHLLQRSARLVDIFAVFAISQKTEDGRNLDNPDIQDIWPLFERVLSLQHPKPHRSAVVLTKLDLRADWALPPSLFLQEIVKDKKRFAWIQEQNIPVFPVSSCGYRRNGELWEPNVNNALQCLVSKRFEDWRPENLGPLVSFLFSPPSCGRFSLMSPRLPQRVLPKRRIGIRPQSQTVEIAANVALVGSTSSGKTRLRLALHKQAISDLSLGRGNYS